MKLQRFEALGCVLRFHRGKCTLLCLTGGSKRLRGPCTNGHPRMHLRPPQFSLVRKESHWCDARGCKDVFMHRSHIGWPSTCPEVPPGLPECGFSVKPRDTDLRYSLLFPALKMCVLSAPWWVKSDDHELQNPRTQSQAGLTSDLDSPRMSSM